MGYLFMFAPKILQKIKRTVGYAIIYFLPMKAGANFAQIKIQDLYRSASISKADMEALTVLIGLFCLLLLVSLFRPKLLFKPAIGIAIMGATILAANHLPLQGLAHSILRVIVLSVGMALGAFLIIYDFLEGILDGYYWLKDKLFYRSKTHATWKGNFTNTTQKGDALANYVCDLYNALGGKAVTTTEMKAKGLISSGPGDQGADVIVSFGNGRVLAIQCKNYEAPIGNSAVQEIIASKAFYGATDLAIIAPNGFTKRCIELAKAQSEHYDVRLDLIDEEKLSSLATRAKAKKSLVS